MEKRSPMLENYIRKLLEVEQWEKWYGCIGFAWNDGVVYVCIY